MGRRGPVQAGGPTGPVGPTGPAASSNNVSYTPSNANEWPQPAPTTAKAALDILAPTKDIQATWYVDGANVTGLAADTNSGLTALLPLLTWAEFSRRVPDWTSLDSAVTVHSLSDAVSSDVWTLKGALKPGGAVIVDGTPQIAKTGTLSAVTFIDASTNIPYQVTDSLGASWATYAARGYYLRITSGANSGAVAPIEKNLGAGACRLGEFIQPTGSNVFSPMQLSTPFAGTETYDVYRPSYLPLIVGSLEAPVFGNPDFTATLVFNDCAVQHPNNLTPGSTLRGTAWMAFFGCVFNGRFDMSTYVVSFIGCQFGGAIAACTVRCNECFEVDVLSGSIHRDNSELVVKGVPNFYVDFNFMCTGKALPYLLAGTQAVIINMAIFDASYAFGVWQVYPNTVATFEYGTLWGSGNTGPAVNIESWGQGQHTSHAFPIVITGPTFLLNGETSTTVQRSDTHAWVGPIDHTFVNLLASYASSGFNGSVVNLNTVTGFVESAG